jgi:hypothetical protein
MRAGWFSQEDGSANHACLTLPKQDQDQDQDQDQHYVHNQSIVHSPSYIHIWINVAPAHASANNQSRCRVFIPSPFPIICPYTAHRSLFAGLSLSLSQSFPTLFHRPAAPLFSSVPTPRTRGSLGNGTQPRFIQLSRVMNASPLPLLSPSPLSSLLSPLSSLRHQHPLLRSHRQPWPRGEGMFIHVHHISSHHATTEGQQYGAERCGLNREGFVPCGWQSSSGGEKSSCVCLCYGLYLIDYCIPIWLDICSRRTVSIHPSTYLHIYYRCTYLHISIYLSLSLSISLSIHLSLYLSLYLSSSSSLSVLPLAYRTQSAFRHYA